MITYLVSMGFDYQSVCQMSLWEAVIFLSDRGLTLRDSYEQMRYSMLASLQPYSKKPLSPSDVMKFDWDSDSDSGSSEIDLAYVDSILKNKQH